MLAAIHAIFLSILLSSSKEQFGKSSLALIIILSTSKAHADYQVLLCTSQCRLCSCWQNVDAELSKVSLYTQNMVCSWQLGWYHWATVESTLASGATASQLD